MHEAHRQPLPRPALALLLCLLQPMVGLGMQAVVYVKRSHGHAIVRSGLQGAVKKRGGVAPAAVGHGDAARGHRSGDQRSFVSL